MIIGTVDNSTKAYISFPFFAGMAGIRDRGDGELQVAFFHPALTALDVPLPNLRPALMFAAEASAASAKSSCLADIEGAGVIDGRPYIVLGSAVASSVSGMAVMLVRQSPSSDGPAEHLPDVE